MSLTTKLKVRVVNPLAETFARLRRPHHHPHRPGARHHFVRAAIASVLMLVVALGLIATLLFIVPSKFGYLRNQVTAAIQQSLGPGYSVSVGATSMSLDRVSGIVVKLDDVRIRDSGGQVVANVPLTTLAIDARALLRFRAAIRTVEMNGAEIFFARSPGGSVYLGNDATANAASASRPQEAVEAASATGADADGGFPDLVQALRILDRGIEPPISRAVAAGFERFSLTKSTISIWDAASKRHRSFRHADLAVSVDGDAGRVIVDLGVSGYSGRWTVTAERAIDGDRHGRNLSLLFSQITLADIFPSVATETFPIKSDIPLYGRASIRLSEFGEIEDASVRLDLGAGIITVGRRGDAIQLDEATIKLRWDVANQVLLVEPSTIFSGNTRGVWVGSIRPLGEENERRYAFELESRGTVLSPRDSTAQPLSVQRIAISGNYDIARRLLTIDSGTLVSAVASFAAAGTVGFEGPTPSLAMAASFSPMPIWALKQMWPPVIASGARRWVLKYVTEGQITAGRFEAAIPAGILWNEDFPPIAEDAVRLQLRVEGATFRPFGDLPPIENASANVVLAGRTFGLDLDSGTVVTPSGERISLDIGAFAVPRTGPVHPDAQLEVQISGSTQGLAEVANAAPLRALERQKLVATGFGGTGSVAVSVRWPLRPELTEADVDWRVSLDLKEFSSTQPLQGRTVQKGNLSAEINRNEVTISGNAEIDGVVADVGIVQPISGTTTGSTGGTQIRLSLDEKARERLGIGMSDVLGGTVMASVASLPGEGGGQHYELDLTRARLTLAALGWSKGIGVPATATFDLVPVNGALEARNIHVQGEGFGLAGSAKLDSKYGLITAELTRLSLRQGDMLAATVKRSGNTYVINAQGESFDARGIISRFGETGEPGGAGSDVSVAITARINRLVGFNRETVDNAQINLNFSGGALRVVDLTGAFGPASVKAGYRDQARGASLDVAIGDAGRFFRFIDLYTRMAGGTLTIAAQGSGSGAQLVGSLDIRDFSVINEPAMDRVVSNNGSQERPRSAFNPSNVMFDRLFANFAKRDSVMVIEDAVLRGNQIGATFGGVFDMSSGRLSLTGTYIPSYALNNAFSRIPIFGLALGGGLNEGLVGVTFKVDGPMSGPQLFINPLSAIAPGIFRKIFEFQ